jgi:hypothetical protein
MRILGWILRFFIPFTVLYTIGYLVPGYSALTILWIALLAALITISEWLVLKVFGERINRVGGLIIDFLLVTFIIFTVTLAIEGGNVPFGGALLAATIIAGLNMFLIKPKIMNR